MQFALLISVIVLLLLSAFLLLTHVQSFFRIKSQELTGGLALCNDQIFESLDESKTFSDTLVASVDSKKAKLVSTYHGAWIKTFSKVNIHGRKVAKTAFTGSVLDQKTPNLYLSNTNSPLVVVGNTRLEGNSYLPKQGVKAGNISGKYYQGSNLYYGHVIESAEKLPNMAPKWIAYLESASNGALLEGENTITLQKEIKNSFYKPSQFIFDPGTIVLGNEKITGNIIIQSETKIVVSSASQLEDVVLIAPNIIIDDNVKGKMQLVASKKIKIGKQCYLSYPSSITLLDKNIVQETSGNNFQAKTVDFVIHKNTVIEGSIVYLKKKHETKDRIKTHLKIESGVQIIGEVYCQGNVDFQGIVKGSLYTNQFIANQSGSIYLNHIYNGKVLLNPIPKYAGLPFINSKNTVAKWLY